MENKVIERIQSLVWSDDLELVRLGRIVFWACKPTYADALLVEKTTEDKLTEKEFNDLKKDREAEFATAEPIDVNEILEGVSESNSAETP